MLARDDSVIHVRCARESTTVHATAHGAASAGQRREDSQLSGSPVRPPCHPQDHILYSAAVEPLADRCMIARRAFGHGNFGKRSGGCLPALAERSDPSIKNQCEPSKRANDRLTYHNPVPRASPRSLASRVSRGAYVSYHVSAIYVYSNIAARARAGLAAAGVARRHRARALGIAGPAPGTYMQ